MLCQLIILPHPVSDEAFYEAANIQITDTSPPSPLRTKGCNFLRAWRRKRHFSVNQSDYTALE